MKQSIYLTISIYIMLNNICFFVVKFSTDVKILSLVVDFCVLMIMCILCLFYSYEYIGGFIIVVGGYSITVALILAIINMVGMIKSKRKSK